MLQFQQKRAEYNPNVSINNALSALRDDMKLYWIKDYSIRQGCCSLGFSFFFLCVPDSLQFLKNNILLKSKILHSCKPD